MQTENNNSTIIKHSSSEKGRIHFISSKEKPQLNSTEKNKHSIMPKGIYSICHKKN
jgi:hypothetical protein